MSDSFKTALGVPGDGTGRCLIIGEVAQVHEGSLGTAHAFIDAIANAGADAVKFQAHIASAESTPAEPWRVRFSPQDATRYDYWRRMEFTETKWRGLFEHAVSCGLLFLSSPFSLAAVELLERIGVPAWKVIGRLPQDTLYGDGHAGERIARLLAASRSASKSS